DVAGNSTALDEVIVGRAEKVLLGGVPGEPAHLLRAAIAIIQGYRGADSEQGKILADMGAVDRFAILGPLSAFHLLDFDQLTPAERSGSIAGPVSSPFGPISPRNLASPEGRFNLANEGPVGDVYVLAVDVDVAVKDDYVVRAVTSSTNRAYLDG